jgi:uncharacterized protein YbjT (DUF2867 family)
VVTGATGTIGRRVARLLIADHDVWSLNRDPQRAARSGTAGRHIGVDLSDRPAVKEALAGADALLVITFDPVEPRHDRNLVEAAQAAGIAHVVKVSALAVTDPGSDDLVTRWQRECEALWCASGLAPTLLRPRVYMSNCLGWAPSIRAGGSVDVLDGTSPNACVDPSDVAAAAAAVLREPVPHAGRAYALTGPQPLTAREQVEVLADTLQQSLRIRYLTPTQAMENWRARYPEPLAQALLERAERQRSGVKATVEEGVRTLTGRAPGTFRAWAERHATYFRTTPAAPADVQRDRG